MKELPHLENLWQKYQEDDVRIFLVDITDATRSVPKYADSPQPEPFLNERGLNMPLLLYTYGMAMEKYVPDIFSLFWKSFTTSSKVIKSP